MCTVLLLNLATTEGRAFTLMWPGHLVYMVSSRKYLASYEYTLHGSQKRYRASLVPSPTPSFSSLLSTVKRVLSSDEKLGVGLGTRLL